MNAEVECLWPNAQVPAKIDRLKIYWSLLADQLGDGIIYSSCALGWHIKAL